MLHPHLLDICKILRKYYRDSTIIIVTNGILLDTFDGIFFNNLKNLNVCISISEYPIKKNYENIIDKYNYGTFITRKDRSQMFNISLTKDKIDNDHYYHCDYSGLWNSKRKWFRCVQLKINGDFYLCNIPANIKLVNEYFGTNFETIKGKYGDYVNIYEIDNADDILYGYNNMIPFCKYCSKMDNTKLVEWANSKRNLNEWCVID